MTWISNPSPVCRAGHVASAKGDDSYAEFVHRRTGEVLIFGAPIPASKCTSRPDCPCEFCIQTRVELSEGSSERDIQDRLAEDFIDSYLQPAHVDSLRGRRA
jgi:hypothetical protein